MLLQIRLNEQQADGEYYEDAENGGGSYYDKNGDYWENEGNAEAAEGVYVADEYYDENEDEAKRKCRRRK
jgi:hypothetical protein